MPHSSLGAAVAAAAATSSSSGIGSQMIAALTAIEAWVLAQGRSFIDTPGERDSIERQAVAIFDDLFNHGQKNVVLDALLLAAIDRLLVYLASAPTVTTVTTVVTPPATQGAAP